MFHYIDRPHTSSFPIRLVKSESESLESVETDLGRKTLVVAVITVDAYPFLGFSDLSPSGYRNNCFLVALCLLIVRD